MLWLYRRVVFGAITHDSIAKIEPIQRREIIILAPMAILVLWMGIYPAILLDSVNQSVALLMEHFTENDIILLAERMVE